MNKLICAVTVLAVSTAQAAIINVPGDQPTIQAGIDAAVNGDEVVVAPGVWVISATISFRGAAITVRSSDGPEVTTIDRGGIQNEVVTINSQDVVVIDGFTITGGDRGIQISGGSNATIQNCIVHSNTILGLFVSGSTASIENCSFLTNPQGMRIAEGNVTITDCVFDSNSGPDDGGGLHIEPGASTTVIDSIFVDNAADRGGAIFMELGSQAQIVNCTFIDNTADIGGAIWNNADPTIVNSLFVGNDAFFGGAMFNAAGLNMPSIVNCTIANNTALAGGGVLNDDFTILSISNSILWSNIPDNFLNDDLAVTLLQYTDVDPFTGVPPGPGNVSFPPDFVDPVNGNYRLLPSSNVIDRGHNWAIAGTSDTDLDGNPRFAEGPVGHLGCGVPVIVDMGAYEFGGVPFPVKLGDIDGDGVVGITDFLALLADWGSCTQTCCLSDLDLDGFVGIVDFLILLGNWG